MPEQKFANPAPLGLMGFGMTTILLNLHNAGLFSLDSMILSMGIFYGGIAQIIAGILEFKKGNTFGLTAFTSYGLFWISLVFLLAFPQIGLWSERPCNIAMASYLFMWGLFTLFMYFGASKKNVAIQFVFGSLTVLFFLLSLSEVTGITFIKTIAGLEGIICGFSAVYLAMTEVLNEVYGKEVLPICPKKK